MVADVIGNVIVVLSVPAKVRVLLNEITLALAMVRVPVDAVIMSPLVGEAYPKVPFVALKLLKN